MMIFNVFGRLMGVKRVGEAWLLFNVTLPERKYARCYDIVLPWELNEEEIAGYLADIYHEAATPQRPEVFRIE
ncbi:DUF7661 family protein [Serratia ficaria]|uniref:DUF7661 family protein n=1 Tax=Serratia ficaria TaxID=61651 RepID=UPI00077C9D57|nr:hypothetical protein [Serratia ficaria]CAI0884390.1 Uncharacterised protein [Serratia ficaria]CAI1749153.1 Uncharacterised protein [Serratia ficaria]CAI1883186.1 Uncharacterised protein [Serratia ficaria]CAI2400076.1 Uncharacterised protein [Serratia ficaria]VVA49950.1 hypothetical protein SERVES_03709 [Serratia ficaria]